MKQFLLWLANVLLIASASAASFDCGKAQSDVEKMVCTSNELKMLDLQLYKVYSRTVRLWAKDDNVLASQLAWLRESRNKCKTNECLAKAYNARIASLESGIHYTECEGALSTVGQGFCEKRQTSEAENSIRDLTKILSTRYAPQHIERFNNIQSNWRKNVVCECYKEVGNIMGPGDSLNFSECERKAIEQRLSEIQEILAGLHDIEYGATGPGCAKLRAEEEVNPEHKMMQAITNNDIEAVRKLIGEGIKLPKGTYSFTPLDIAARNNNLGMFSFLMDNGANPANDIEAMKAALKTCNMKMVTLLVDHGYKVKGNSNYYGPYDPLPWAAQFGCRDIVEYLVANGADVKSYKPLRLAASQCHVGTVKYLLSKVQDPDLPDGDNRTPLWGAAITAVNWPDKRSACMVVISDLIQAGANPERAFVVPVENPALKLPRDDNEVMRLLHSRSNAN